MAYKTSNFNSLDPIGPTCKKAMYNSLAEAQDMIRYIKENRTVRDLQAYECTICGMWHLTSKLK